MIKKLNVYFFDQEKISSHDAIWFYGPFVIGIVTIVLLMNAINF